MLAFTLASHTTAVAEAADGLPPSRQYWGEETNGVKAGVYFQLVSGSTNEVQVLFVPALCNSRTDNGNVAPNRLLLLFPPFDSRYELQLTDLAGRPVEKTKKGDALGKAYVYSRPLGMHAGSSRAQGVTLTPNKPEIIWETTTKGHDIRLLWLSLQDYFKIQKSGRYHLKFQMRVLFWNRSPEDEEKALEKSLYLPAVEADIEVQLPAHT
jgi:hypothetical protein